MSNEKDKQILEDYLKGDTPLSRQYRAHAHEEPPAHLDAAIITAANKSLTGKTSGNRRWYVPLSLAAMVVISFGLVFRVYQTVPQPGPELPASAAEEFLLKDAPSEDAANEAKSRSLEIQMQKSQSYGADDKAGYLKEERMHESELRRDASAALDNSSTVPAETAAGAAALSVPEPEVLQPMTAPTMGERDEMESAAKRKQLEPQQWFEIINQLWFDGDEAGATNATKRFLEAYPDYPPDELKKMLPQDMDLSKIIQ